MKAHGTRPTRLARQTAVVILSASLAAVLAAPTAAAPGTTKRFEPLATVTLSAANTDAWDVALADLDGDGIDDIVVVSNATVRMSVYLSDGKGGYASSLHQPLPAPATAVALADFDMDGKNDFAWGDILGTIWILYGDGNGGVNFAKGQPPHPTGGAPVSDLEVGLIDSNLSPDLIAADPTGSRIWTLRNNGLGFMPPGNIMPHPAPPGSITQAVDVGYLDSNAHLDFVTSDALSGNVYLFAGDGSGGFMSMGAPYGTGGNATADVILANLNGDARSDIVASTAAGKLVTFLSGSGNSYARKDYTTGPLPSWMTSVCDATAGYDHVAVACSGDGTIRVLENDGAGTLEEADSLGMSSVVAIEQGMTTLDQKCDIVGVDAGAARVFRNSTPPTTIRSAGADRYETSVELSRDVFQTANVVVVATGEDFPDALAGTPLAAELGAPILLSRRDALPPIVAAEIARLGATEAIVLGETGAVSDGVVGQIEAAGVGVGNVTRYGGADRYETAYEIAMALQHANATTDVGSAFVATGENFPDALAGGAFAAVEYAPILLVRRDVVPPATERALADLPTIADSYILGGEGVVAPTVAGRFPSPTRLAGPDRYATSNAIAEAAAAKLETDYRWVPLALGVATGENFPDALALGPIVAPLGGPVLLTRTDALPATTETFIGEHAKDAVFCYIAGGTGAVSAGVEQAIEAAY